MTLFHLSLLEFCYRFWQSLSKIHSGFPWVPWSSSFVIYLILGTSQFAKPSWLPVRRRRLPETTSRSYQLSPINGSCGTACPNSYSTSLCRAPSALVGRATTALAHPYLANESSPPCSSLSAADKPRFGPSCGTIHYQEFLFAIRGYRCLILRGLVTLLLPAMFFVAKAALLCSCVHQQDLLLPAMSIRRTR